jgi:ABC-2 type transport system permease protein
MKTILRIAKVELAILFYSPIAWCLMLIFLFQCGYIYVNLIDNYFVSEGVYNNSFDFMTNEIFVHGGWGMLPQVLNYLYLYLPLLTMGLMSRELSSGTIKLLYSSPIKIREIIFGKYMAMMLYNLLFIGILGVFCIAGYFNIRDLDSGQILSALLGIYLLLCTYAAIGLFMSSLTGYQVVAAITTLAIFAGLANVGTIGQDIDFVRDLTYCLSLNSRVYHLLIGYMTTRDIIYFVVIIYVFLGLSILKLLRAREIKSILTSYGRYAGLILSAITISYVSSRPALMGYFDTTRAKSNTIDVNTQKILKDIGNSPLEVTSYINLLDRNYYRGKPSERNADMERWEPYVRFKPDIKFKYVYYYDSIPAPNLLYKDYPGKTLQEKAEFRAKSWRVDLNDFKSPAEIKKIIDLKPEQNRYVMQLKFKGKSTFLRLYDDPLIFPSEAEVGAALRRLTEKLPTVVFLQGEFERNPNKAGDRDLYNLTSDITFRHALINQGFNVDTISLAHREIPTGIAALIIADPRTDFEPEVLAKIQKFVHDGGNLLIAGEPGRQSVLNPLIQPLGVRLMDGILVQQSKDYAPDLVFPYLTPAASAFTRRLKFDFADSLRTSMPSVAGLSYTTGKDFLVEPLLMTDKRYSWEKKNKLVLDSADVVYSPKDGDYKKSFATALSLTRNINGHEQRIIITGDADFLSNGELNRQMIIGNFDFNTAIFSRFSYGRFPVDIAPNISLDNHTTMTQAGLTIMKYLFLGILPAIVLLLGTIILIRRKRK